MKISIRMRVLSGLLWVAGSAYAAADGAGGGSPVVPLKADVPPRVLTQKSPEYPIEMRRYGITGSVEVRFVVSASGRVINPVVFESENPAFDEPAIKAVSRWTFTPGLREGRAVNAEARVRIYFELASGPSGKQFGIQKVRNASGNPNAPVFDKEPRLKGVMIPVYPTELRKAGVTGKAAVDMLINTEGRIERVRLRSADRPEFGFALMAAAEGFRFEPALYEGRPVAVWIGLDQEFTEENLTDVSAERLLKMEKKRPGKIVGARQLDAAPKPISQRSPLFPRSLLEAKVYTGEARIEFVIDAEGHARLPRVVSASADEFGYAGMQAVNTWLFVPPLMAGKPVATRASITFAFKTEETPATPAGDRG